MFNLTIVKQLVNELNKLPGVGVKSAQKMAYYILKSPKSYSKKIQEILSLIERNIHSCPICFNFTDKEICEYCTDQNKSNQTICVVEEPFDIERIESSQSFTGKYHVLQGVISPLEDIKPEDIKIKELINRINNPIHSDYNIKELIFALDADLEGDTTVLYIANLLSDKNIKITRLAYGIPIGSNIDYVDSRTISKALENRMEL